MKTDIGQAIYKQGNTGLGKNMGIKMNKQIQKTAKPKQIKRLGIGRFKIN